MSTINKPQLILFDLDGTLLDTAPDLAYALNHILVKHGRSPLSLQAIRPVASNGTPGLLGLGFQITPEHEDYQTLRSELFAAYHSHIDVDTTLFPQMPVLLEYLNQQQLQWGIVTNKPRFLAEKLLGCFDFVKNCQILIGGDDVVKRKPDPEGLLLACQKLNVPQQHTVYIGDAKRDVDAARRAKMRSIVALYGYIADDEEPHSWEADCYASGAEDIVACLQQFTD